jgi:hypothetical protein
MPQALAITWQHLIPAQEAAAAIRTALTSAKKLWNHPALSRMLDG